MAILCADVLRFVLTVSLGVFYIEMAEDMIIELESRILGLKRTELLQFGEEMKWISAEEIGEKGRLDLIRIIRTVFEEEIQKGDSEQLRSLLEKIQSVLDGKSTTQSEENTNAKEKNVEELKQLQTQFENLLVQQEELKNKITPMQSQTDTVESTTAKPPKQQDDQQDTYNLKTSMLRREFKIQGQIGEPGQKDKLAYQSLISQIEIGLGKGYTEEEVTNAVVRSIQAGLQLRSYLEGLAGLTLPRLRKILRFHFQEKSATELYQLLTNISQAQRESPQEFLIRALTIRQKIVFTSKKGDSKIKYDEQLVQGLFLHALETGLLSPFSTLVFRRRWRKISPAKNLISCSFVPSAKGQTEDENFQRLDQQNKFLQRRMNVKNDFYVKLFRRRRRNDGVENGL